MTRAYSFFLLFLACLLHAQQDTLVVNRQDIVNQVQNNIQTQIDQKEIASAQADLLQSRALHLPDITLSYTGMNTNNPLMAFGSKLNQEVVTMADFDPELLNNPDIIFNFESKLEVQQPIYNRDGYWQKKAGEVKVNALQFKAERTKEYLEMEAAKKRNCHANKYNFLFLAACAAIRYIQLGNCLQKISLQGVC